MSLEVKCDVHKPIDKWSNLWQRLFNRFARGDIIRFQYMYGNLKGIFFGQYKMTDPQIHIQLIDGWGDRKGTVEIQEFLMWENEWSKAELIVPCDNFKSIYHVMNWWRARREWVKKVNRK